MPILLPLLAALIPLLITPGLLFHFDIVPKIVLLTLAAAAALCMPRRNADTMAGLWTIPAGRWLCLLAFAQILWFAAASALSTRPWFSLLGSNWRRMGLLTIAPLLVFTVLAAAHLRMRPGLMIRVFRAFAVAAIIASIYGITQYFDLDPLQNPATYHAQAGDSTIVRPPGTLGHADYFGWWLAIAFFCATGLARVESGRWRFTALTAAILSGAAILLSGTRAAMLGVAVGAVCFARLSGIKPGARHVRTAVGLTAILLAFYFSPAGTRLRARVHWSLDEPLGGARPLLWRDSLRMAAARPLAGFGPETFPAEFPHYQSTDLARLVPGFFHESPHNTALDALTAEGIPGLLLAFGWLGLGAYGAVRALRSGSRLAPALTSAFIASCIVSIFTAVTLGPLFATLLIVAMLIAIAPGAGAPSKLCRPATVFAASIPLVVCFAVFGVDLAVSDFNLARFQRGSPVAVGIYRLIAQTALPGASEDLYCSRQLTGICAADPAIRADCSRTAVEAALRATVTSDNPPNAWYNFAMFAAAQNNGPAVERSLATASSLAPNWFKPHWALANLYALTGRAGEARIEAERAVFLDAGKDAEVIQTRQKLTPPPR